MSIPDPDEVMEVMDARMNEPIDETDFDYSNANDMDEDMGQPILPEDSEVNMEQVSPAQCVVNSCPENLETIRGTYDGPALISRLKFIAEVCPPLRKDALVMLINYLYKNTFDVQTYVNAHHNLESVRQSMATATSSNNQADAEVLDDMELDMLPTIDSNWVDTTTAKTQTYLENLLADLKRYKEEGSKDSIRRITIEIFQLYMKAGMWDDAGKFYARGSRECCTSPKHIIQMSLQLLEVTVYTSQWQRIESLVLQIDRSIGEVLEAESVAATSTSRASRFVMGITKAAAKHIEELVNIAKAKMSAACAVYRLSSKQYRKAAQSCTDINIDHFDCPTFLSAKDIALIGSICALATYNRSELKEKILGSTLFLKFLESEPKIVELLEKFCGSQFGDCIDLLAALRDNLLIHIHLWSHVDDLYQMIKKRAIIQYFTPYCVADLNNMATVFRTNVQSLEVELMQLIQKGEMKARIDSINKRLIMVKDNEVADTYVRLLDLDRSLNERAYDIILRAAIHSSKIVVGSREISSRFRRRPAHEFDLGDEFDDRCPGKLYGMSAEYCETAQGSSVSNTPTVNLQGAQGNRSFMSRIFGTNRMTMPSVAEPDSSNETNDLNPMKLPMVVQSTSEANPQISSPAVVPPSGNDTSQRMEADEMDAPEDNIPMVQEAVVADISSDADQQNRNA